MDRQDLLYRNKWDGWREFYTTKRFVAFGPYGWQGNPNLDWTAVLPSVLQRRPPAPLEDPGAGVCPVPDDVALERMLRARSAASAFDGAPSAADLWEARAAVLGAAYAPQRDGAPYDASRADAALLSHLAY